MEANKIRKYTSTNTPASNDISKLFIEEEVNSGRYMNQSDFPVGVQERQGGPLEEG